MENQVPFPEHLAKLKEGVEAWNQWRKMNRRVHPYLDGADLRGAKLMGINLHLTSLVEADLSDADLRESNLMGAYLNGARLDNANLQGARLDGAKLGCSKMRGAILCRAALCASDLNCADLRDAYLGGADFREADLTEADLTRAQLSQSNHELGYFDRNACFLGTLLDATKICGADGLETALHLGPSSVTARFLTTAAKELQIAPERRSAVEQFLRGAGLPESFLQLLSTLVANPIEFNRCFILYSDADKTFARRMYDTLQERGIRCWLDDMDVEIGDRPLPPLGRGFRRHDRLILICSAQSLSSPGMQEEVEWASELEEREGLEIILPLSLDESLGWWEHECAVDLQDRLAADFTGWESDNAKFEKQFEKVVRALQTKEPKPGETSP